MANLGNIPTELKEIDNWILWRLEYDKKEGKDKKIPYSISGYHASSNKSDTWTSYENAIRFLKNNPEYSGLGFCISSSCNYVGIDLDRCVVGNEITPDASEITQKLRSYTEKSVSGTGLHTIIKVTDKNGYPHSEKYHGFDFKEMELCFDKFFYMSGDIYQNYNVIEDRTEEIEALRNHLEARGYRKGQSKDKGTTINRSTECGTKTETELHDLSLQVISQVKDIEKFKKLYEGDISDYPSHSEADFAFCCLLANHTQDEEVIFYIIKKSKLYRDKWERDDYRNSTISKAIDSMKTDDKNKANNHKGGRSMEELREVTKEPISWLVEGLLPEDGLCGLVAKPKVGKSTLLRNFAVAIAEGKDILGRKVKQGKVLAFFFEESAYDIRESMEKLGANNDINMRFYLYDDFKDVTDRVSYVKEQIEYHKPRLVILDTLFRIVEMKEGNNYVEALKKCEPVLIAARENKVCLLVGMHAAKNSDDKDAINAILGSTGIGATVDMAMHLKKQPYPYQRTLETVQRRGKDMEETFLVFDENTDSITIGDVVRERVKKDYLFDVENLLWENKEEMTEKRIVELVGGNRTRILQAVLELHNKQTLIRSGEGKKGNPYTYIHKRWAPDANKSIAELLGVG
jgi:predicted ATP-dependent serine protease